jgi:hypothetical protein
VPTLVGIDHGFSFPLRYFEVHRLKPDWSAFLDDFQRHWPTDENIYVDFVRDGIAGNGAARMGNARWRRLTEERSGSAKSVFHFDVCGDVWRHPRRSADDRTVAGLFAAPNKLGSAITAARKNRRTLTLRASAFRTMGSIEAHSL